MSVQSVPAGITNLQLGATQADFSGTISVTMLRSVYDPLGVHLQAKTVQSVSGTFAKWLVENQYATTTDPALPVQSTQALNGGLSSSKAAALDSFLVNVGTEEVPVWELQANVIPRTDSLVNLQALSSGSGELSSATDVAAIVQLNGVPGSGTAAVYTPMSVGVWNESVTPHEFRTPPLTADGAGKGITIKPANGFGAFGFGGILALYGGDGTGASGGAGSVFIRGGDSAGGVMGDVTIQARSGAANGIVLRDAGATSVIQVGTTNQTLGFYNSVPVTKRTVTGSRGGNAALASLITALAQLGFVTDSSSA